MTLNSKTNKVTNLEQYAVVAKSIADLVVEKQIAYGDSFGKSDQILAVLYPAGIKADQVKDALTIVRIIDKLFRIANQKDAFGESPWKDIMGYALLATVRDIRLKELKSEEDTYKHKCYDPEFKHAS